MNQQLVEILKACVYAGAAFGAVATIARDYGSNYVSRKEADIRYLNEKAKHINEILATDGYKEYQKKRTEIAKELIEKEPAVIRNGFSVFYPFNPCNEIGDILDGTLGCDPLERL